MLTTRDLLTPDERERVLASCVFADDGTELGTVQYDHPPHLHAAFVENNLYSHGNALVSEETLPDGWIRTVYQLNDQR